MIRGCPQHCAWRLLSARYGDLSSSAADNTASRARHFDLGSLAGSWPAFQNAMIRPQNWGNGGNWGTSRKGARCGG